MKNNIIADKTYQFAIRVVRLYKWLCEEKKEYVISKQILRSGTSIGAMIREAQHAESKADFLHKVSIALKEANEVEYWLLLLKDTEYILPEHYSSVQESCDEIKRLLVKIVKTTKANLGRQVS